MISIRVVAVLGCLAFVTAQNEGDTCDNNDACTFDTNAVCEKNKHCDKGACTCKDGWAYHSTDKRCYEKGLKVGDTYVNWAQCSGDHMMTSASGQTCVCQDGFTGSSGDKNCDWGDLKALGEVVSYVSQCKAKKYSYDEDKKGHTPYTEDDGVTLNAAKQCACSTGWKADGDKCVVSLKEKDESCTLSTECDNNNYPGAGCYSGKCMCATGKTFFEVWYALDYYKNYCLDTAAVVDIKAKEVCGSSHTAPQTTCAKGLACRVCPGTTTSTCIDGASFSSLSAALLLACMTLLAAVYSH